METNQRKFHRLAAQVDCEICFDDATTLEGRVRDVSLCGVFVCCDSCPSVDTKCQVYFVDGASTGTRIGPVPGKVKRTEDDGMAIEFDGVPDEACIQFLQDLILTAEPG